MKKVSLFLCLSGTLTLLLLAGCHGHDHNSDDDHHHSLSLTAWNETLEVMAEFEEPELNKAQTWTLYLTRLQDHQAYEASSVAFLFRHESGRISQYPADTVSPGVFAQQLTLADPGHYQLSVRVTTHDAEYRLPLGNVDVATDHDHGNSHNEEGVESIYFPKVQQWRTPFATSLVEQNTIAPYITTTARLEASPERRVRITTPTTGILMTPENQSWPRLGSRVKAGDILAQVIPMAGADDLNQLQLDRVQAHERAQLAERELTRVKRLHEQGVVPERRLEEVQAEHTLAKETLERTQARLSQITGNRRASINALPLHAPIDGIVIDNTLSPGDLASQGDALFTLLDDRSLVVRARLYPDDFLTVQNPHSLRLRTADGRWLTPSPKAAGRLIPALDNSGTASLVFEIDNDDAALIVGTSVSVAVQSADEQQHITVPTSAVLDDDGIAVVIVQQQGELFERRVVRTGIRAFGQIAITEGLRAGERIVTQGAYPVLLASRDTSTEVGHSH